MVTGNSMMKLLKKYHHHQTYVCNVHCSHRQHDWLYVVQYRQHLFGLRYHCYLCRIGNSLSLQIGLLQELLILLNGWSLGFVSGLDLLLLLSNLEFKGSTRALPAILSSQKGMMEFHYQAGYSSYPQSNTKRRTHLWRQRRWKR